MPRTINLSRLPPNPMPFDRKAYQHRWYLANRERLAKQQKAYNERNAAQIKKRKSESYFANLAKNKARRKAYYVAHRTEAIARAAEWQSANREQLNRSRRVSFKRIESSRRVKAPIYAEKRRVSGKARAYNRILTKRHRDAITDKYAREMLAKHSTLKMADFSQELVELKKAQLRLKAALKNP